MDTMILHISIKITTQRKRERSMGLVPWSKLAVLLCAALTTVNGAQIPLTPPLSSHFLKSATPALWDFNVTPNLNSTSHLIFDTVASLSQHWTNTRYRNGHNIVPGTVPVGTLLYHGTDKHEVPAGPEWTATDPEHSYLFCRSAPTSDGSSSGCWHLTLVVTRPLKVLYFDGSSAAKMYGGSMDTQDIVIWGEVKPDWTFSERTRINELCEWGREFGLDGFVRMEMDFEIMLCDFTVAVEIVSFLNLNSGMNRGRHRPPSKPPGREPSFEPVPSFPPPNDDVSSILQYRVIEAGVWHNTYPGETRINLDLNGLISFYDTDLFPSLAVARFGQERWKHRLQGLSVVDSKAFQTRIREVLEQIGHTGSGIDWSTLIRVVVDRYAERLEILQYLLNSTSTIEQAKRVQKHLRSMVVPYILHTSVPNSDFNNHSWALPVYEHCATTHTRYISSIPSILTRMTKSESLILRSVQEVSKEICRVVVGMWAEGVELGLDAISPASLSSVPARKFESVEIINAVRRWQERTEGLMAWLDWSVWVKCRPACGYEEICYLPTWPFIPGSGHGPRPPRPDVGQYRVKAQLQGADDGEEDPVLPQPKCIRRVEPFTGI